MANGEREALLKREELWIALVAIIGAATNYSISPDEQALFPTLAVGVVGAVSALIAWLGRNLKAQ